MDDYLSENIRKYCRDLILNTFFMVQQNEDLMTAIHESSPQHQTIQAHVVEEIMPDQLTEVTDVKEVINQLLPTRKRKPRVKKPCTGKQILVQNVMRRKINTSSAFICSFSLSQYQTVSKTEPHATNAGTENEIENSPPKAKKPKSPRDPNSKRIEINHLSFAFH